MLILSLCDNAEVLSVIRIVNIMIKVIQIGVPIALIVSLMLEFMHAITSHDQDALKKAQNMAIKRAIATVLVLMVPTFVNFITGVIDEDNTYKQCMENATVENIQAAFTAQASRLMDIAVEKASSSTYLLAKVAVNKISDEATKQAYLKELEDVKVIIDAKDALALVSRTKKEKDYEKAVAAVELIEDETVKKELTKELETIAKSMKNYASEYSSSGAVANPLGLPYYNQCDSRWGSYQYDTGGATLCSSSCGYTSYSMIAAGFTGDFSINPYTIVEHFRAPLPSSRGYGAAADAELQSNSHAAQFGMSVEVLFGRGSSLSASQKQNLIQNAVNQGKAVIILRPWHYVVVVSDGSGNVILLDPARSGNNGAHTIAEVYSIMQNNSAEKSSPAFVMAMAYTKQY